MAFKITIPFHSVRLNFYDNHAIVPMAEHTLIRIDQTAKGIAKKFESAFQRKVLNKGLYSAILDNFHEGKYEQAEIQIEFPAAKDGISYPDVTLDFDYLYKKTEKGFWAVIPALGLESYAVEEKELHENIEQTIKLEFARTRRLSMVQRIVASIWFDSMELLQHDVDLEFHTPAELERLNEKKKEEILPKVAERLSFNKKVIFGRHKELDQISRALKGKFNKSIILVGASGVGKTALIWEVVRQKYKFNIKSDVYETTASTLIKELTQQTGWQDNLVYLCRELSKKGDILFIRNLLELFEVGQYEGNSVSMAEYIRTFISRGEITIISECTEEEFARIELKNPNYTAFFQVIKITEPPKDELEDIIIKKTNQTAQAENISIELEAIKETIRLNRRYTPYSGFPGKPIRFLESILLNQKAIQRQRRDANNAYHAESQLDRSAVIGHFCEETGMPPFMVDPNVEMNIIDIRRFFFDNVFGQDVAVHSIVDLLASVKVALTRQGKPIASFLFVGPTGVGKTEMAKVLAQFMFGSRDRMIRFDMSEYSNPYAVQRLTGLSYFEDGLLTSAIRREPFCVLLFDEIEKAHPLFYDLLLQMLGEGRLTDSRGKLVNFCSTIIIMTSNIGASKLQNNRLGWKKDIDTEAITEHFMSSVRKHFRPELFNRIDKVIPFEPLTKDVIRFVVDREVALFKKREGIKYRKMDFYMSDEVLDYLGEVGYDIKYGARRLQRAIRDELIIPLAHQLNNFEFDDQLIVNVNIKEQKITVTIEADPLKLDLLLEELEQTEFADHTCDLRRNINELKEGRFYISLLSELDIMERRKKKNEVKFWKNKDFANKYGFYLKTKNTTNELTADIEAIELDLALMAMEMKQYRTEIKEDVKIWEAEYFDLKVELYNRLNPQSKKAFFGLYGKHYKKTLKLYLKIFEEKRFDYEAMAIWYRESHYNELIEVKIPYTNENTGETLYKIEKKPRAKYVESECDFSKNLNPRPPKKGDRLVGFELELKGNCPFLYLENEGGIHQWKMENKDPENIWIQCSTEIFETNNSLHRKKFWDEHKKTRRTISDNYFNDSNLRIKREVKPNQLMEFLIGVLDRTFLKRLDQELL